MRLNRKIQAHETRGNRGDDPHVREKGEKEDF